MINDPILAELETRWLSATPGEKAQIVVTLIRYVKRKYSIANFKSSIDRKTKELESIVGQLELKELLIVTAAVGYARKEIHELGRNYGIGLKRKPRGRELADARSFKPIDILGGTDFIETDDLDDELGNEF